ncbi:DUF1987 domain-containing protein [Alkalilimnicola ehrlichii MLHE-1]|uniref:SiaC family regulatory phosphoprotein domain-containing protein n=1 Tax=Alkalilimnicola ehrlichii (strain ATCC BAA-1101 / DSM 17681 / MLHE-1) TaxID=187272 RepID=Q0A9X3_ALKEH|nr:DUF1987 domain-containing protein [Alkalilimnicola ehrlichii]ABI56364.1 conserved hypothetical protein [Alkalilimnicola ehrlichii MLHE-1]
MTIDPIDLEATDRTPRVLFDPQAGRFEMSGESYPEDAAAFFGPIMEALKAFLADPEGAALQVRLEMAYFNSSSAKALMNMFQLLEDAAGEGREVTVDWYYQAGDDTMEEFGEDFSEDFEHAEFHLNERDDASASS